MNELMLREINDQAPAVEAALEGLRHQAASLPRPRNLERIILSGSGDSLIAAEAVAPLFRVHAGLEVRVATSLEASRYLAYTAADCLVVISVSGQVIRPIEAATRARAEGATVLAVVAREDSRLGGVAHGQLVMPTPLARNTPHSRDYTLTLLSLAVLLESIAQHGASTLDCHLTQLEALPAVIRETLEASFAGIPDAIVAAGDPWFLGAGPDRATAMYGALKFWEAGLRAHWDDLEEFGHGSQLMARPGEAAILLASGPGLGRAVEMVSGLRRMGLLPWIISSDPLPDGIEGLRIPSLGELVWSPFVTCLPLQVLIYRTALRHGIDVTRPPGSPEYTKVLEEVHVEWTRESELVVPG